MLKMHRRFIVANLFYAAGSYTCLLSNINLVYIIIMKLLLFSLHLQSTAHNNYVSTCIIRHNDEQQNNCYL